MSIQLHTALSQFFHIYRLVSPLLIFACVLMECPVYIIVVILVIYFAPFLITWLVPAQCVGIGCVGHMRATSERWNFWTIKLVYRCDNCDLVYQREIFSPNIDVSVEFS